MLSEGHASARNYPLWMLWQEAAIVRRRYVDKARTEAVLIQQAIVSVVSKEGGKAFANALRRLEEDGER